MNFDAFTPLHKLGVGFLAAALACGFGWLIVGICGIAKGAYDWLRGSPR